MNSHPRVLVVDDERFHLNVIVDLLSDNYTVLAAKNGERALEIALSKTPPDLILLDILMPHMDGYEVCRRLKANKKTAAIPVVFLTVKSDVTDEAHGFDLGVVDYIAKPFSPPILKARVATHIALSKALRELANQNEQLEFRVQERTREFMIAQQESERLQLRLQQAQKMEAIGLLTGGIAHDFNNILSTIIGFSDLALNDLGADKGEDLAEYLDQIGHAGERAKELVEQLLAFSRGVPSKAQPLNLAELADAVVKLLQPILPSNIEISTEFDDMAPAVMFDKIQMHQLVMNLCINARDAMNGEGFLSLKLHYHQGVEAVCGACQAAIKGDFVELVVADNGSGIEPTVLRDIFEPFYSTKEIGKGTGMGLSVVNDIAHKQHGHIVVDSTLGKGTAFSVLFPPAQATKACLQWGQCDDEDVAPLAATKKHIMLIDDDISVAFFIKELLELNGYRVSVYNDSVKALEVISAQPGMFDLVMTDYLMPDLDGVALAQAIHDRGLQVPVILCSGGEVSHSAKGVVKTLIKPLQSESLIQVIQSLFSTTT